MTLVSDGDGMVPLNLRIGMLQVDLFVVCWPLQPFLLNHGHVSGKKKAHKHKLFGPVALGTPRECRRDKPGLSPGQSGFVPGTNPGFLLILHSGSPVCPWDKPSLSRGHSGDERRQAEFMC